MRVIAAFPRPLSVVAWRLRAVLLDGPIAFIALAVVLGVTVSAVARATTEPPATPPLVFRADPSASKRDAKVAARATAEPREAMPTAPPPPAALREAPRSPIVFATGPAPRGVDKSRAADRKKARAPKTRVRFAHGRRGL